MNIERGSDEVNRGLIDVSDIRTRQGTRVEADQWEYRGRVRYKSQVEDAGWRIATLYILSLDRNGPSKGRTTAFNT
jgi:hypothetical protein